MPSASPPVADNGPLETAGEISDYLLYAPSDSCKQLLINERMPEKQFVFPVRSYNDHSKKNGVCKRSCQPAWLEKYDFLTYSKKLDGLFCLSCVLFPTVPRHGTRARLLITEPFRDWKAAISYVANHSTLDYHRQSMAMMTALQETMKNPKKRIDLSISDKARQTVETNRKILSSIIKCLEYCGRQGIALRGHRDNFAGATTTTDVQNGNPGNFLSLIKFRVDSGDNVLKMHLDMCQKNATYLSNNSQNDLLDCIKEFIQSEIVKDVKAQPIGPLFGIEADEVRDSSNWEQLGIVLRYLKEDEPVERLIEFVPLKRTTGQDVCNALLECLQRLGLRPENCRGQTYDGAGNMSGKQKGCAASFQKMSPRALYCHCANHDLNLALSKACSLPEVHIMLSVIKSVGIFFKYSPKRSRELEKTVANLQEGSGSSVKQAQHIEKIKLLSDTRWVERHTCLNDFDILYEAIVATLETISSKALQSETEWDSKAVTEANGLLHQLTSWPFIVTFRCAAYLFGFTKSLSTMLQGRSMDIVQAYEEITLILKELEDIRCHAEKEFGKLFSLSEDMGRRVGIEDVTMPRTNKRQTLRNNAPADHPESYYRRAIFVPYLDGLTAEIRARFSNLSCQAIRALCLIPANLDHLTTDRQNELHKYYHEDLPERDSFEQEMRLWKRKWENLEERPSTLTSTLKAVNVRQFPNVATIMRIVLLQPATSASVERSNSALKRVKTDLRSTISEDRMNALLLLLVHRDIELDVGKIIDSFANKHPRRMMLANPMQ